MADLTRLQSDLPVNIAGVNPSTGIGTTFVEVDANGNMFVLPTNAGPVTPGTVATNSGLAGGQYNTTLPTLTNTQQASLQLTSTGALIVSSTSTSTAVGTLTNNNAAPAANNLGVLPGLAEGTLNAARYTTGDQVLLVTDLAGNTNVDLQYYLGAAVSTTNPIATTISDGTHVITAAISAYGTAPTGTEVMGVNAYITNIPTVNQGTSPWITKDQSDGPVTPGTVAAFSQLAGGQYNSTLPTLTTGQQASLQLDSSGRLIISPTSTLDVGVADKTAFTYGTSLELPVGGVYQDTAPTLAAGTTGVFRLNVNRAHHVTLRDPTTDIGVSTASNNNATPQQMLTVQVPDTTVASTALGALNATIQITMAGLSSVGFQLAAGTLIGTITPQCSIDGGTTWVGCNFYSSASSAVSSSITFATANTLTILSILPVGGSGLVRVIVTAYTSGTANAVMRASEVTAAAGAITAAAFGTVNNTYVTLNVNTTTELIVANPIRKYLYISNNSGGLIVIQFGSATGLTSTARGLVIPNNNYYELKGDNLYTGPIFAYTTASGLVIAVTEGTP